MIIAIDGPAAAGKGTLANRLKTKLNYAYLDTGALYRSVAVMVAEGGGDVDNEAVAVEYAKKLTPEIITEMQTSPKLRTPEAGQGASKVSVHPSVRQALFDFQRDFGTNPNVDGAILDGRDIGTVIFPDADLKFFITASPEVRANRRLLEFISNGISAEYDNILDEIKKRDERDMNRADAPLKPAPDAIIIDTSDMTEDQVFDTAISHFKG